MKIHPGAEQQLQELALDDADIALLEHVFGDDRPPQGLHQQGFRQTEEEREWEAEWRYPADDSWDDL